MYEFFSAKANMTAITQQIEDGLSSILNVLTKLQWTDIPKDVQYKAALIFADDLSAITAASSQKELQQFLQQLISFSGPAESTLFNNSQALVDRYTAALANGSSGTWCEVDTGYLPAVCHASLYCLPAILAEGEAMGNTVQEMLEAFLYGYLIIARVARTFEYDGLILPPHGSLAAIGSVTAVSFLRKIPQQKIFDAICTAATLVNPGPFQHAVDGGLIRNIWAGIGASNGLRAADLTNFGITGTPKSLYNVFVENFGARVNADYLVPKPEFEWAVMQSYHKQFACCQYSHSAIEAVLKILSKMEPRPNFKAIERIRLKTHWRGKLLSNLEPKTTLAAKFSMEHILATSIYHGSANVEAFNSETLNNQDIKELRDKVDMYLYDPEPISPNDRPAEVSIQLSDGKKYTHECLIAEGSASKPFTSETVRHKIRCTLLRHYPNLHIPLKSILELEEITLKAPWREILQE